MSENKTYYKSYIKRYKRDGEEMVIWSTDNNHNDIINRVGIKIKHLNNKEIRDAIIKSKKIKSEPLKVARIEVLSDVLLKRRKQKLNKICSKLEIK